jgi:hypothetical protein
MRRSCSLTGKLKDRCPLYQGLFLYLTLTEGVGKCTGLRGGETTRERKQSRRISEVSSMIEPASIICPMENLAAGRCPIESRKCLEDWCSGESAIQMHRYACNNGTVFCSVFSSTEGGLTFMTGVRLPVMQPKMGEGILFLLNLNSRIRKRSHRLR